MFIVRNRIELLKKYLLRIIYTIKAQEPLCSSSKRLWPKEFEKKEETSEVEQSRSKLRNRFQLLATAVIVCGGNYRKRMALAIVCAHRLGCKAGITS